MKTKTTHAQRVALLQAAILKSLITNELGDCFEDDGQFNDLVYEVAGTGQPGRPDRADDEAAATAYEDRLLSEAREGLVKELRKVVHVLKARTR